ncbi:MAG: hypothetical protein PVJ67_05930 [Candidatus Pacearchaeota archaeon]|jgi:hypothetical protein
MKKVVMILTLVFFFVTLVSAKCTLDVSLVNQDPYPAVPGDYVKLLFQVTGTENPDCAYITFELKEKYPISFDPGETGLVQIKGGTFQRDYSSSLTVPFKVRLDENALDGANRIEVIYGSGATQNQTYFSKLFDIEVDDTHADFEIYVKDYEPTTNILTLEVLNIAESDVEAVTIEIPEQEGIKILGARTDILGDIDSNEYTTADFTIKPGEGIIKLNIYYSDAINERRTIEKEIYFNPEYFSSNEKQATPWYTYLIYILIIGGVGYYFYKRRKKKKEHKHHSRGMSRLG